MIRTGFSMVMVEEQCWTGNLNLCFKLFSKHYPEKKQEMKEILTRLSTFSKLTIEYITTLAQYAGTSAYVEEYVGIIRDKSILRQVIDAAQSIEKEAFSNPSNVLKAIEEAQHRFDRIRQSSELAIELERNNTSFFDNLGKIIGDRDFAYSLEKRSYDVSDKTEDWMLIEKPHTWMQYKKSLLRTLTTSSPTWLHFNIAVKVLTHSEEKIEPDSKLIELLAKKFIEACKDLNRRMRYPKALDHLFTMDNTSQSKFEIVRVNDEKYDKEFLGNGLFIWDTAYL